MAPYDPSYHYNHYNKHHHEPGVKSPPVVFPGEAQTTTYNSPVTATESIIDKINEIVSSYITTPTTIFAETVTGGSADNLGSIDDALNAMGVFNGSASGAAGDTVGVNIGTENAFVSEAVTENLSIPLVTEAVQVIEEKTTEIAELTTKLYKESVFDTISTTVRNFIWREEGAGFHSIHEGHVDHDSGSKNAPYLILVIILAVLVVIASVALFLYIRHKNARKTSLGVSVVGKSYGSHKLGDKTPAGQSQANLCEEDTPVQKKKSETKAIK